MQVLDLVRNVLTTHKDNDPEAAFGDGCGFSEEEIAGAPPVELDPEPEGVE